MISILAFLLAVLPQCAVEDDPWCVVDSTHVNLAPADPAPFTLEVSP